MDLMNIMPVITIAARRDMREMEVVAAPSCNNLRQGVVGLANHIVNKLFPAISSM